MIRKMLKNKYLLFSLLYSFKLEGTDGALPENMNEDPNLMNMIKNNITALNNTSAQSYMERIHQIITNIKDIPNDKQKVLFDLLMSKVEEDEKVAKETYVQMRRANSLTWKIGIDIILKAFFTAFCADLVAHGMDYIFNRYTTKSSLLNLIYMAGLVIQQYETIPPLKLEPQQQEFLFAFNTAFLDFLKNPSKKPFMESLIGFQGVSGTGKTTLMYVLMAETKKQEKRYRKVSNWRKFLGKLPNWAKILLNVVETKDGIYVIIPGSYFYDKSNEREKAAASLDAILSTLISHITGNKKKFFILCIDEGEGLFQEPFGRVFKIRTSELAKLNASSKDGYGIIMVTTNNIEQFSETFERRMQMVNFSNPSAKNKLIVFNTYLQENLSSHQYSSTIINHINDWIEYCEMFSHSDMENIIWLLKLHYATTHEIITSLYLLQVVYLEWKKRQFIVNKKTNEEARLPALEKIIVSMEGEWNEFFNSLIIPSPN